MIKLYFSLLFLFLVTAMSYGQFKCPPIFGNNTVREFHLTGGGGLTHLYGDIDKPGTVGFGVYGRADLTIIKGLTFGGEGQIGSLEAVASIKDPRQLYTNYFNIGAGITLYPFEMLDQRRLHKLTFSQKVVRGLYAGIGVGYMRNYHRANNYRDLNNPGTFGPPATNNVLVDRKFKERTSSLLLPVVNAGLALPFRNSQFKRGGYWSAILNAQLNFSNNDDTDGYVPLKPDGTSLGKSNDYYSFYSLGLRYSIPF
ncbi:hypothetical protein G5B30_06000 [Sphingobacterium sp. SGG-5]|uniref:hypothetical protein n=1 Tax=Sphingobacterium sp. SGG-5 TaxID=2710881 RepID=UPI0013EACA84|nr:hypothetical protein [Sphingobacterium sp. SGG-5]NGM61471.1 hypothetical protein [Sphingobacterium sp. SGG-5]